MVLPMECQDEDLVAGILLSLIHVLLSMWALPQDLRGHGECNNKLLGSANSSFSTHLLAWTTYFLSRNQCPENK